MDDVATHAIKIPKFMAGTLTAVKKETTHLSTITQPKFATLVVELTCNTPYL